MSYSVDRCHHVYMIPRPVVLNAVRNADVAPLDLLELTHVTRTTSRIFCCISGDSTSISFTWSGSSYPSRILLNFTSWSRSYLSYPRSIDSRTSLRVNPWNSTHLVILSILFSRMNGSRAGERARIYSSHHQTRKTASLNVGSWL